MNSPVRFLITLLAAIVVCAGCGQKGPLYLPDDPSRIQSEMPPQTPAPDAETAGEEDADERKDPDGSAPD